MERRSLVHPCIDHLSSAGSSIGGHLDNALASSALAGAQIDTSLHPVQTDNPMHLFWAWLTLESLLYLGVDN
jgi:hypothetical protein